MPRQMSTPLSMPLPTQAPPNTSIPTPRPPQPAAPTFPAYQGKSNSVETPNPPPVDVSSSNTNAGLKSLGSKTRIICPDENVSLVSRALVS